MPLSFPLSCNGSWSEMSFIIHLFVILPQTLFGWGFATAIVAYNAPTYSSEEWDHCCKFDSAFITPPRFLMQMYLPPFEFLIAVVRFELMCDKGGSSIVCDYLEQPPEICSCACSCNKLIELATALSSSDSRCPFQTYGLAAVYNNWQLTARFAINLIGFLRALTLFVTHV